jgi:hypothetical protein
MAARVALTILGVVALTVLCTYLGGCGATLPDRSYTPNASDALLFEELEARWAAAGLENLDTERCVELRQYMRIVVANDEELGGFCHRCPPGNCPGYRASTGCRYACGFECYVTPCVGSWPHCWGTGNEFLGGHEHALIVVHESQLEGNYPNAALVRHGYLHYLTHCSGAAHGTSDPDHRDERIWALDAPEAVGASTGATAPR